MAEKDIKFETSRYVYDLNNLAKEHGFKAEENWELSMESVAGKTKLQRDFYPNNVAKISPDILLQVLHSVKNKLQLPLTEDEANASRKKLELDEIQYLVAYNPKRPRN
ncbi:MAG: hypothetical protein JKY70_15610 [Mucilaginibacter sp.]|nr:hypothetical protein [Mucilaginibacter sp.]